MQRRVLLAVAAVGVLLVVVAFASGVLSQTQASSQQVRMNGSFFVSDAGESHGGFEYTASYNVSLDVRGDRGVMTLVLDSGLGDVLTEHEYQVTGFQQSTNEVAMIVNGHYVRMPMVLNDTVWGNTYDNHYIASWGPNSPKAELFGTIIPAIFSGIPNLYYVELRLA